MKETKTYIYTVATCPKTDTWLADGGRCGWAHECNECKDNPENWGK